MGVLRIKKPSNSLTALLIVLFICFLFLYHPSKSTQRIESKSETRKLVQVLKRASMIDRTVIVTVVNEEWARTGSVLDLFLESFRIGQGTERLLNHLLIVALEDQSFQYCMSLHPHCFHLQTSAKKLAIWKQHPSIDPNRVEFLWERNDFLLEVLELGYNVVFTEADVMWFRNPILHFEPLSFLHIGCESIRESNIADGGFFFAKSDEMVLEFFRYQKLVRIIYPNSRYQSLCEIGRKDTTVEMLGTRIKYFDTALFGSFCWPSKDMSKICTFQANCCNNVEDKIHDLKLVLDDWRNFTARSAESISWGESSPSWTAPDKCKIENIFLSQR